VHKGADWREELVEVEAMIRSAGEYVQVSRDLRPRVIDKARLTNSERRVRRYIRHAGLVAAVLTWIVTATVDRMNGASEWCEVTLTTATKTSTTTVRAGTGGDEPAWCLVNGFTELRGKQAEVLRLNQ